MNHIQKKLKDTIEQQLSPIIDSDYVLWDLPYHFNIGDILIWKGEEDFLTSLPFLCKDRGDAYSFNEDIVNKKDIIILHGGGNFGDLYRDHQDFRLSIIKKFPHNKIIILPQSIFYEDENRLRSDAQIMALHKNLYICARDNYSYNLLKTNFSNHIFLTPDMAYCINPEDLHYSRDISYSLRQKSLFLQRTDIERTESNIGINPCYDYKDWPTFERVFFRFRILGLLQRLLRIYNSKRLKKLYNKYADNNIKNKLPKIGIKFFRSYSEIITTRLHGLILATLLNIKVKYRDNKSRKISDFVNTWLSEYCEVSKFENGNNSI